jgi:hypothetical protein
MFHRKYFGANRFLKLKLKVLHTSIFISSTIYFKVPFPQGEGIRQATIIEISSRLRESSDGFVFKFKLVQMIRTSQTKSKLEHNTIKKITMISRKVKHRYT